MGNANYLAERLVSEAALARSRGQLITFRRHVTVLTERPGTAGWETVVDRVLRTFLWRGITTAWTRNWQPVDLTRYVARELGTRHERLAADSIAAELRAYAPASVDERWAGQLDEVGATVWWDDDARWLRDWAGREEVGPEDAISCAIELLTVLTGLPALASIGPRPGQAQGKPRPVAHVEDEAVDQRKLKTVRALLAKAESTEFPEEAEALTARAQEMMSRHSIDAALLAAETGSRDEPSGRRVGIDRPYEAPKATLLAVVADANGCRAVWHKQLGFSTVLGFPADLDAVEMLFTSLLVQSTTALVRAGTRRDVLGRSRTRSFRQSFLAAYAYRIGERLREARDAAATQAAAGSGGKDLVPVLAARARAVDEAMDAMFSRLTSHSAGVIRDREGWMAGTAAADLATLSSRSEVRS